MTGIPPWLLDVLACPADASPLVADDTSGELLCQACDRAYPVILDGVPVMLLERARHRGAV